MVKRVKTKCQVCGRFTFRYGIVATSKELKFKVCSEPCIDKLEHIDRKEGAKNI